MKFFTQPYFFERRKKNTGLPPVFFAYAAFGASTAGSVFTSAEAGAATGSVTGVTGVAGTDFISSINIFCIELVGLVTTTEEQP